MRMGRGNSSNPPVSSRVVSGVNYTLLSLLSMDPVSGGRDGNRNGKEVFSSHGEPLLEQQTAVGAPDFYSPVTVVHALPTVGAITLGRIGLNPQPFGLPQRASVIPAMLHCGVLRGPDARVENDRSRRCGVTRRIAAPVAAARRERTA